MWNMTWWWADFLFVWETSLANAYLLMKNMYLAMGCKPKWTYWKFQEESAWVLLDPDGPTMRKDTSPTKELMHQRVHIQRAKGTKRREMTNTLLDLDGVYRKHLDMTSHHFPTNVPADKRKITVCQLYHLANDIFNGDRKVPEEARREIMVCMTCDTALCVQC